MVKWITFLSKNSAFLLECTENSDCTAPNRTVCDENKQCQCDAGLVEDDEGNCVGTLKYKVIQKAIHKY